MKERIAHYDIAKGILILLMLVGHVWVEGWVRRWIYVFHMPAFFLVSGMLQRNSVSLTKPLYRLALKKARSFLIPYFFFEMFSVGEVFLLGNPVLNIKGYVHQTLLLQFTNGPLWFLIVLLCAELLFAAAWKLKHPAVLPALTGALLLGSFFFPPQWGFISLPMIATALLFLCGGYLVQPLAVKPSWTLLLGSLAVTALLSVLNPVEIDNYQSGVRGLFLLSGLCGGLFIVQLSLRFKSCKPLSFLGRNSLIILGTHYPLLRAARWLLHTEKPDLPIGALMLIMLLAAEIPLILLINHCLPFILGKWYRSRD